MKIIFALFLSLVCLFSYAQKSHPDTLLAKAEGLLYSNTQRAIKLVEPVLMSGNEDQVFDACYLLGDANYLLGNLELSEVYYEKCELLGESENDEQKLALAYLGLGTVYTETGRPDDGLDYLFEALAIQEQLKDKVAISNVLNNIAVFFHTQGKYNEAIKYMHQVCALDRENGDSSALGYTYSNLGAFHYFNEANDSALFYHNKSYEIRTNLKEDFQRARSLNNIANVLVDMGEFDKAMQVYEEAIAIKRSMDNPMELALVLDNVGQSLIMSGEEVRAFPYLLEANGILDSLNDKDNLIKNSRYLAYSYAAKRNFKEAYELLDVTYKLRTSLFDEAKSQQAEEMMAKFETERTQKENEQLRASKAEDALALEKSKNRSYLLIGGIVLIGLVALMVFGRLRTNRKNTEALKGLYDQLEEKNTSILDSIRYAKRIQKAILPSHSTLKNALPSSFIFYRPKDVVAGDFYWMEQKNGQTYFAVVDCTGHGVPGAMVSVVCNHALNRSVRELNLNEPSDILDESRKIVIAEFQKSDENVNDGMDIALCSLDGRKLKYAGAHNSIYIIRKGVFDSVPDHERMRLEEHGEYQLLEVRADRQPIGKHIKNDPFTGHELELMPEDNVYLFSDGYMDQFGGKEHKKMKSVNFKKLLIKVQPHNMQDQKQFLADMFDKWRGDIEQIDDVCLMGIKIQ